MTGSIVYDVAGQVVMEKDRSMGMSMIRPALWSLPVEAITDDTACFVRDPEGWLRYPADPSWFQMVYVLTGEDVEGRYVYEQEYRVTPVPEYGGYV